MYRWGFKPNHSFYFEVKSKDGNGPVYEYDTVIGKVISDLLTDYATMLLREMTHIAQQPSAASAAAAEVEEITVAGSPRNGNESSLAVFAPVWRHVLL